MARPKKPIDPEHIHELREAGLSIRQIARETGIPRDRVFRTVRKLSENPFNVVKPQLSENCPKTVRKPPTSMMEKRVRKPAPPKSKPSGIVPPKPELPQLDLGELHHFLFTVAYKGSRPRSGLITTYGYNNSCHASVFEIGNYTIQIHKHKIEVWARGIQGDTSEDLKAKARGRARAVLAALARKHGLDIAWDTLEAKTAPHITFGKAHADTDTMVMGMVRENPGEAKEDLGMLAGDRSHPDNVEFIGEKGEASFNALSFAIKQLPVLAIRIGEYNENIQLHLKVQRETLKTLKAIRKELKR